MGPETCLMRINFSSRAAAHPPDLHTDLEPSSARLWKAGKTSGPRAR